MYSDGVWSRSIRISESLLYIHITNLVASTLIILNLTHPNSVGDKTASIVNLKGVPEGSKRSCSRHRKGTTAIYRGRIMKTLHITENLHFCN